MRATQRACRWIMAAPYTTTARVPGKSIPYGDRPATRPASRTRGRRHTSRPRRRAGGRCCRCFPARKHRRVLRSVWTGSPRQMSWGEKCIIRYRSFDRPSKGGAVCRGDDPDVWRERRKRINASADPLSRNSHARPSQSYMRRIFKAFFAYCSGECAGSFIVLFLVGGHGGTAWRSFRRPCCFCRRQIYLIFVAWLTGRVFSLRRENSLERVITASMRRQASVVSGPVPDMLLSFFFFCYYSG